MQRDSPIHCLKLSLPKGSLGSFKTGSKEERITLMLNTFLTKCFCLKPKYLQSQLQHKDKYGLKIKLTVKVLCKGKSKIINGLSTS